MFEEFCLRQIVLKFGFDYNASQRAFLAFGMRNRDHRSLQHFGIRHDGVFQILARDPLAAALDQILGAVNDLHEALSVNRDDVSGPEPAIHERVGASLVIEIAANDPWPAHLQFAEGFAVPWALFPPYVHRADLHARY